MPAPGQEILGAAFPNVCVPGALPRKRAGTQTLECGGLCAPNSVTSTLNTQDEGGIAPDSCSARWGASAPNNGSSGESCRFYWMMEPFEPASRYGNSVGICFQHAGSFYDSNMDGTLDAMWPRCTSLTTGDVVPPVQVPAGNDALEFACLPYPMRKQAEALVRPVAPTVLPHRFINWR